MQAIADGLIAALFAPACVSCERVLDAPTRSPMCDGCWDRIQRFATPEVSGLDGASLSGVRAVGPFDGVLRDVVHALKFNGRRSLARRLAPLLLEAGGGVLDDADALVPVPLHPWRHWRRGYNQAALLAEALGRPVWHVLRRRRATMPQTALGRDERRANVGRAFAPGGWTPGSASRARRQAAGRTLVLVDDVLTTGATLDACAGVLREAGAREVRALVVARALVGRSA